MVLMRLTLCPWYVKKPYIYLLNHSNGKECSPTLKWARTALQNNFFVMLAFCFNIHFTDYKAITHNTFSTHEVVYPAKGGLTHDL